MTPFNPVAYPSAAALDRNLALEVVRVTESSALAASVWVGRGDERAADEAAVVAMRQTLNSLSMDGVIANGEGQSPEIPLHTGEAVGSGGGPKVDIALFALEGRTACAKGGHNTLSLVALTEGDGFLKVPDDIYMDKLAVGAGFPDGILDLDISPEQMVDRVAQAKGVANTQITVCVLDRPRHGKLITALYDAGVKVILIDDGDVSGALATGLPESGIDLYMGSGGAAQGVLAAAGLKCLGGQIQCRFQPRSDDERNKCRRFGLGDLTRKLDLGQMVRGEVMLAATGITDGHLLKGITMRGGKAVSHSVVMRSLTGTVRWLTAHHDLAKLSEQGLGRPSNVR